MLDFFYSNAALQRSLFRYATASIARQDQADALHGGMKTGCSHRQCTLILASFLGGPNLGERSLGMRSSDWSDRLQRSMNHIV